MLPGPWSRTLTILSSPQKYSPIKMAQRTVQVGDLTQITVEGQAYNFPITSIDSQGIQAGSYLIIPQGTNWQVQGYALPHTVSFLPAPSIRDKITPFLDEARMLSGREITLKKGPRFISLVYQDGGFEYTFARVDKETGDVYSQSGSKPHDKSLWWEGAHQCRGSDCQSTESRKATSRADLFVLIHLPSLEGDAFLIQCIDPMLQARLVDVS
jgi:hypothetical protein